MSEMLQIGHKIAPFTHPGPDGSPFSSAEWVKKGPLVVFFYPAALTAGCTLQTCSFRDYYSDFQAFGASIVGISSDPPGRQHEFMQRRELPFPLLSDPEFKLHQVFGFPPGQKARATFVLDAEHQIVFAFQAGLRFWAHSRKALDVVKAMTGNSTPKPLI